MCDVNDEKLISELAERLSDADVVSLWTEGRLLCLVTQTNCRETILTKFTVHARSRVLAAIENARYEFLRHEELDPSSLSGTTEVSMFTRRD